MIKNLVPVVFLALLGVTTFGAVFAPTNISQEPLYNIDCQSPIPSGEIAPPPERPEGYCPDAPGYAIDLACAANCRANYEESVKSLRERLDKEHEEVCDMFQKGIDDSYFDYMNCLLTGNYSICSKQYVDLVDSFVEGYNSYRSGLVSQYQAELDDLAREYWRCMENCCYKLKEF